MIQIPRGSKECGKCGGMNMKNWRKCAQIQSCLIGEMVTCA